MQMLLLGRGLHRQWAWGTNRWYRLQWHAYQLSWRHHALEWEKREERKVEALIRWVDHFQAGLRKGAVVFNSVESYLQFTLTISHTFSGVLEQEASFIWLLGRVNPIYLSPYKPQCRDTCWTMTFYILVTHAEMNAVVNMTPQSVAGCAIYVTVHPCNECAKVLVRSGEYIESNQLCFTKTCHLLYAKFNCWLLNVELESYSTHSFHECNVALKRSSRCLPTIVDQLRRWNLCVEVKRMYSRGSRNLLVPNVPSKSIRAC